MWVGLVLYFCSIGTNQVRDIASCKEEVESNLTLPLSDSQGCSACLLVLFSLIAFCTLIFTEVVFYLAPLPLQKEIFPSFTIPFFPLRTGSPLQEEKETLLVLRMAGG